MMFDFYMFWFDFLYVLVRFLYPFTRGWHNFATEKKYVRMNIVCFQLLVIINF